MRGCLAEDEDTPRANNGHVREIRHATTVLSARLPILRCFTFAGQAAIVASTKRYIFDSLPTTLGADWRAAVAKDRHAVSKSIVYRPSVWRGLIITKNPGPRFATIARHTGARGLQ